MGHQRRFSGCEGSARSRRRGGPFGRGAGVCVGVSGVTVLLLARGAAGADPTMLPLIDSTFTYAAGQETNTINYLQAVNGANYLTLYPRDTNPTTGVWQHFQTVTSVSWIAGFLPGSFWMMYAHTGDASWMTQAKAFTAGIAAIQNDPIDSDLGFRTVPSFYQGWLLSNDQNDPGAVYRAQAASVLVNTATSLATRFDAGGWPVGAIKSWGTGNYPVYVDDLVNNTLFFAAWNVSGRPTSGAVHQLYEDAITTAATTLTNHVSRGWQRVSHCRFQFERAGDGQERQPVSAGLPGVGAGEHVVARAVVGDVWIYRSVQVHAGGWKRESGAISDGGGEHQRLLHQPPAEQLCGGHLQLHGGGFCAAVGF